MLFQKIHKPQPTNPLYDTNILIFSLLPTIHNILLQFHSLTDKVSRKTTNNYLSKNCNQDNFTMTKSGKNH